MGNYQVVLISVTIKTALNGRKKLLKGSGQQHLQLYIPSQISEKQEFTL